MGPPRRAPPPPHDREALVEDERRRRRQPREHDPRPRPQARPDCVEVAALIQRSYSRLEVVPCSIQDAKSFVDQHHRHHPAPVSGLFAVAAAMEDKIVGVAIVGRPVARFLQDGWTCELTRCCTDGTPNAASFLYGRAWRAAQMLGWKRMVTYTLASEDGGSLRGCGWKMVGHVRGRSWSTPSRPRVDRHPTQSKMRWEVAKT